MPEPTPPSLQPPPHRDLILGTAKGYRWAQLEAFVASWQTHARSARLVLFVAHDLPESERRPLLSAGVELVALPALRTDRFPFLRRFIHSFRIAPLHRALGQLGHRSAHHSPRLRRFLAEFHHIGCSRYFAYLDYVEPRLHSFDRILLTDVRDVVFQANPLPHTPADALLCALETDLNTLSTQPTNARWLDFAYGRPAWQSFGHAPVCCAGTTLGLAPLIATYLRTMTAEISRLTPRLVGQDGLDQAVHNFLLRTHRLPQARFSSNTLGPIATLFGENLDRFPRDSARRLLNPDLRPVPLVHQWDRHPDLASELLTLALHDHRLHHPADLVSFIIPTYGRATTLENTLACALAQDWPSIEIIVVTQDDPPPPALVRLAHTHPDRLHVVRQSPPNANTARNTALRLARGEIILSVDDDVTFGSDYARRHAAHYADPATGFVHALTREDEHSTLPELLATQARTFSLPSVPAPGDCPLISWAPTCSTSYRRSAILRAGWFDPYFTGGVGDDTDLTIRILALGYTGRLDTTIHLRHHASATGGYASRLHDRPLHRQLNDQRMRLYMVDRNLRHIGLTSVLQMHLHVLRTVVALHRSRLGPAAWLLAPLRFLRLAIQAARDAIRATR
ncbi:MAG: hypothetical protein RL376_663 [Verrucomicrobiota bacterium]